MSKIQLFTLMFFCYILTVAGNLYLKEFEKFINEFKRGYSSSEYNYRFNIFSKNLENIRSHNRANHSFKLGIGPFADMTTDEFSYNHLNPFLDSYTTCGVYKYNGLMNSIPNEMDWRNHHAVTDVKNQGSCGSCWSFSTTGAVEGLVAINTGKLISLSEQDLIDCSTSYDNHGCNGGLMTQAFEFIIARKGLCSESNYSYTGQDGTCRKCVKVEGTDINDCKQISSGDYNSIVAALSKQPISVGIQANTFQFQHYNSGIFNSTECFTGEIDHGVLLVAYDKDSLTIKNSWGDTWGENGYIRIARTLNEDGVCGVYQSASFPQKH